ncbi:MAG: PQQ-dependent sugar dehydrogenase, partial [Verrucomicrobia bacterium]|nr:PQQ-dependent sugar dehydrogenase [Cytophagales bacterium]
RLKEGKICFNPDNNCERADLIDPIWDYVYDAGDRSVTGGYVYRGKKYATLVGKYVYGDYAGGRIWTITYENKVATNQLLFERVGSISAFGEDKDGEIYICNHNSGKILTF